MRRWTDHLIRHAARVYRHPAPLYQHSAVVVALFTAIAYSAVAHSVLGSSERAPDGAEHDSAMFSAASHYEPPAAEPGVFISLPDPAAAFRASVALFEESDATIKYQAALSARDSGEYETAVDLFERVAGSGDILAPMADLRLAQSLIAAGAREAATAVFERALDANALPPSLMMIVTNEAAANLVELGRPTEALPLLTSVRQVPGAGAFQRADALWRASRIQREAGDDAWAAKAHDTMRLAPGSSAALEALDTLRDAGVPIPPMLAAQVNYRAYRNEEAATLYRAALDSGALSTWEAATAWFYIGALAERFDAPHDALDAYARSLELAPNGEMADHAIYWRGRVYEELDEPQRAAREYDRLGERFPESSFVRDAHLRGALGLGFSGEREEALQRLHAITQTGSPGAAAEAARWHTVFRTTFGTNSNISLDPGDFHPASLWSLLDDDATAPLPEGHYSEMPPPLEPLSQAELGDIQHWLERERGPRQDLQVGILEDTTTQLALALHLAGERPVSRTLLYEVIAGHREQPYELLDLALATRAHGIHDISMHLGNRLLPPASSLARLEAPMPLLQLAYPAPYPQELRAAVEAHDVPPLLLLAVVRQESSFNPDAVSHAGATGLAQVMPRTGEGIAQSLGEEWALENLYDPETSLRYGAYYLALQLRVFDGNLLTTLAAYNGGGGNAQRWLDEQPFEGADGYIYAVDFNETRAYFEHVLENYAWYRYIYTEAPAPSIR